MAKGNRGGRRGGGGGGINPSDILSTKDMLSAKTPDNAQMVNDFLTVAKNLSEEYGKDSSIDSFQFAVLKPKAATAIAYYDGSHIALNTRYADYNKMNKAYDDCVQSGFHPSRGKKSGAEAVAAHEYGHALTDAVGRKMGISNIDKSATAIVNEARKQTNHRGVVKMASKISEYATHSNAEAVAEAFSDVYCNGKKAKKESQAIVNVMNKYLKGE